MPRSFRRSLSAAVVVAVGAAGALPATADARPAAAQSSSAPEAGTAVHTVRLVTGDTVRVVDGGGRRDVVFQPDADSPTGAARIERLGDRIDVIPDEAQPLLDSGVLDPRLFRVDRLIADGYADGADLPLILQYEKQGTPAPAKADVTRKLSGIKGVAARVDASDTKTFWAALRRGDGATKRALGSDVRRMWLDAKVKADLAQSVPQIGAPTAWAAGYDGKGVTVAELDTGVDATHPDLKGQIAETKNFSNDADAVDHHGHGTHVASTILGTGAASDGKNKGVAPGARLLSGKVLNSNGQGAESWVLAGMDWAAHSGAKVVSMSLGVDTPTDGTDPMSVALNQLSADTGTLFVVAAGNTGPDAATLGSPGAADAALTVGAVDKQDKAAQFSSRGPRLTDGAVKPDISAPGVDIVAARAAGTSMGTPVDSSYTSASGTSMATPHVSGAAAILAGRHPEWSGEQLKRALMSSAKDLTDVGAFTEGSGRVDVAAAIDADVWATGNRSFGTLAAGQGGEPVARTVTFHNPGDQDVTVGLAAALHRDGTAAEVPGALSLSASKLTLPARGDAEATVTLDPAAAAAPGEYSGSVTATGAGIAPAHAEVAFVREQPSFPVTVHTKSRENPITSGEFELLDRKTLKQHEGRVNANGDFTTRAVPGRYTLFGTLRGDGWVLPVSVPDVTVTDGPIELTVDAGKAQEVTAELPVDTRRRSLKVSIQRSLLDTPVVREFSYTLGRPTTRLYLLPSARATDGRYFTTTSFSEAAPTLTGRVDLGRHDVLRPVIETFVGAPVIDGTKRLRVVDAGRGSADDLAGTDVRGALTLVRRAGQDYGAVNAMLARLADEGADTVMIVSDRTPVWVGSGTSRIPAFSVPEDQGERIARAARRDDPLTMSLTGRPDPTHVYEMVTTHDGQIPADQSFAPDPDGFATVRLRNADTGAPGGRQYALDTWLGVSAGSGTGSARFQAMAVGKEQTVHLYTPGTSWTRVTQLTSDAPMMRDALRAYEAGRTYRAETFSPVLRPATPRRDRNLATGLPPSRTQDTVTVQIPVVVDAAGEAWESSYKPAFDTVSTRLYRGDTLLGTSASPYLKVSGAPAGAEDYRIEMDTARKADWWGTSTRTRSVWGFASACPTEAGPQALPLLMADYTLSGTDLTGAVEAGEHSTVSVRFRDSADRVIKLASATVQASYDDGATWVTLHGKRRGTAVEARLKAPRGADAVALRVRGEDTDGSTLDQTVLRAAKVTAGH